LQHQRLRCEQAEQSRDELLHVGNTRAKPVSSRKIAATIATMNSSSLVIEINARFISVSPS
jgi:hypothetical protein